MKNEKLKIKNAKLYCASAHNRVGETKFRLTQDAKNASREIPTKPSEA
jgi:hypothetical protein